MSTRFRDILDLYWEWATNRRAYEDRLAISVSVFEKDNILFQGGYGYADLPRHKIASAETMYRVASISKLFTATAIMQLVEQGLLNLDTVIQEILPEFIIGSSLDYEAVTVRDLLKHSSGLPRESDHDYWFSLDFPDKASVIQSFQRQAQILPKNTMWKYSNLGYAMLGDIVAKVSQQPFEEYIEENIFKPLGLQYSFFRHLSPTYELLASGYSRSLPSNPRKEIPFAECRYFNSAANLVSNVLDLTIFLQSFFNHKEVLLKQATITEMLRCQIINADWADGYGLGFKHTRHEGHTFIGHGGSFQGYISHLSFMPEKNIGIVVLMNSTDSDPHLIAKTGYDFLVPELPMKEAFHHQKPRNTFAQWEGRYRNAWSDIYIQEIDGQLYYFLIREAKPLKTKCLLGPVDDHSFRLQTNIGGLSAGERVFFDNDGQGRRILRVGAGRFWPLRTWMDALDV